MVIFEGYYVYVYEDFYDCDGFCLVKVDEDGQGICVDFLLDVFFIFVNLDVDLVFFVGSILMAFIDFDVNVFDQDFFINLNNSFFMLDLGNDIFICNGVSLLFDLVLDSIVIYQWQDGFIDFIFIVNVFGIYSVMVIQDECIVVDFIVVVILEDVVVLGLDLEVCVGDFVMLGLVFEVLGDYSWSNGVIML